MIETTKRKPNRSKRIEKKFRQRMGRITEALIAAIERCEREGISLWGSYRHA
jgi:hypothetical protein